MSDPAADDWGPPDDAEASGDAGRVRANTDDNNAEGGGTHRVVFSPAGTSAEVPAGTTILDAARSLRVDLDSTCGGRGICGRCQVTPAFGEFAKWRISSDSAAVGPKTSAELGYRGRRSIAADGRLGCQATVLGDLVVDVPAGSQVHRPVVRKTIDLPGLTLDPLIAARYCELEAPVLGDERADAELLTEALAVQWGIVGARIEPRVLPRLQPTLANGSRRVTAIVHADAGVIDVRPGFDEAIYGVAVDVGSTTIAGYLVDLHNGEVLATAGAMNPQIRFGEDLMSRVSYVMMNPGGDAELTAVVREAIDDLIEGLAADHAASAPAGSAPEPAGNPDPEDASAVDPDAGSAAGIRRRICDLVFVGNPVMHHLLLGIDPTGLGAAPFSLAVSAGVDIEARDLGLALPAARAHVGPCIAGHVGADAAAALLNEGVHRAEAPVLVVDVGTNAEIVLGTGSRVYAASSPTGPAFEGAQISSGVRAAAGAIERIRIDRQTYEPRFKVIGADEWSNDPGFDQAVAGLEVAGLCGSAIIEVIGEMFLSGICDRNGVISEAASRRSPRVEPDGRTFRYVIRHGGLRVPELAVTQNDVRQIQLAGAALRASIDLLLEHAGIDEVHDVRLAGAFGAHIDPVYALVLGLIPDCPVAGVRAVGNSSGAGAVRMLVSAAQRREVAAAVAAVDKIETATEPRFQELFVAAMAFPHATAPSPHLGRVVDLPAGEGTASSSRRSRRSSAARRPASPSTQPAAETSAPDTARQPRN